MSREGLGESSYEDDGSTEDPPPCYPKTPEKPHQGTGKRDTGARKYRRRSIGSSMACRSVTWAGAQGRAGKHVETLESTLEYVSSRLGSE
ncbi:hypothetical protein RF55_11049 [Lasius niger]|uniref:Uncharacterized protein n=1 Tax=Lasius niger TaxID=67767 RepID=A0A0J7N9I6_LASNI|nr:hypothetical protein RF55_11049 [Lasius niger]